MDELIEQTWKELGQRLSPVRDLVMVRTEPHEKKIGSLYLPPKLQHFYGELPHLQMVTATALSVGPQCRSIKVGDRIVFSRLFFGRLFTMKDGTLVGYLREDQVSGHRLDPRPPPTSEAAEAA